jgi:hypothetical protein
MKDMDRESKSVYYGGYSGTAVIDNDGDLYVESSDGLISDWQRGGTLDDADDLFEQAVKDYKANRNQDTGTGFYYGPGE